MPNIVTISDFVGEVQLQQDNTTTAKFNYIRDEHTNAYLYKLLGVDLATLFIADLNGSGVPVTARFLSIYNAFASDTDYGAIVQSRGLKFFVKGIVWYFYARQNNHLITTAGNTVKRSENADVSTDPFFLAKNFNSAIETGHAIQWYINDNLSTYPEYNGQELHYLTGL